jgi:hypothetical protein
MKQCNIGERVTSESNRYLKLHFISTQMTLSAVYITPYGPGSSVGIETGYGLDGPGIESRWEGGEIFRTRQDEAHPASCTMGTGSFPG